MEQTGQEAGMDGGRPSGAVPPGSATTGGSQAREQQLSERKRQLLQKLREERAGVAARSALVPLRGGEDAGMVVVHPQGGALFCYSETIRSIPARWRIAGLAAERPVDERTVPELAATYVQAVRATPAPVAAIVGWSTGASIAYEMARQCAGSEGPTPLAVVVDMSPEPTSLGDQQSRLLKVFLGDVIRSGRYGADAADVDALGIDDGVWLGEPLAALEVAVARLRAAGVDLGIEAEDLLTRYQIFRSVVELHDNYRARPSDVPTVVVLAEDTTVDFASWHALVPVVREAVVPGDHYSMMSGEGARALAGVLHAAMLDAVAA